VLLPEGGMLLDTPGMRTLLMWEGEEGLTRTFQYVEANAARCRFRDCEHASEPGCAIRAAIEGGELEAARFRSYLKLKREVIHEAAKTDVRVRRAEIDRWRKIHREARQRPDKRRI
jgi:ribosome biogenesis GTPase